MSIFEFGFAREDITPRLGEPLCGYFNPRPNKGAYDRLALKAAVFRTGSEVAAIVSYDLCLLDSAFLRRIDEKLAYQSCPAVLFRHNHGDGKMIAFEGQIDLFPRGDRLHVPVPSIGGIGIHIIENAVDMTYIFCGKFCTFSIGQLCSMG